MAERYQYNQKGKLISTFEATVETLKALQAISEQMDEMLQIARHATTPTAQAEPEAEVEPEVKVKTNKVKFKKSGRKLDY